MLKMSVLNYTLLRIQEPFNALLCDVRRIRTDHFINQKKNIFILETDQSGSQNFHLEKCGQNSSSYLRLPLVLKGEIFYF